MNHSADMSLVRKPREIVRDMMDAQEDQSENKLQNEVVKRLRPLEDALGFRVVAIPNGGKRRAREGRQLKNRGLRAGFPDLMVLRMEDIQTAPLETASEDIQVGFFFEYGKTILIELKVGKGSLSDEQVEWHAWLGKMMFPVHVATSVASVVAILRSHGLKV